MNHRAPGSTLPDLPFLRLDKDGTVWLDVHVSPNASRTACDGLHDGALRVRLNAPPVDGKANQALIKWLAAALDVPRSAIELARGESARRKQLRIAPPHAATARWSALQA